MKNIELLKSKEWVTTEEVQVLYPPKSRSGVVTFARKLNVPVNKRTGRNLYDHKEIKKALEKTAVRVGV